MKAVAGVCSCINEYGLRAIARGQRRRSSARGIHWQRQGRAPAERSGAPPRTRTAPPDSLLSISHLVLCSLSVVTRPGPGPLNGTPQGRYSPGRSTSVLANDKCRRRYLVSDLAVRTPN
ncbi:hypothetical protein EVAR_59798_1 [Eumeta japonica]|uniref:Uncharacterized protein n=1 Tax=Eumeta variegata TaxID=151549 RepID=A0A4C1YF26_EUMVA|nr:hypothetical protein EVAR_59798_1 [Eumeta japonica]